jgi:hypothetical protein
MWSHPRRPTGTSRAACRGWRSWPTSASSRGLPWSVMLQGTGLAAADLRNHEREVSAAQELRVIRNLVGAAPSVDGVAVGARYHLSTFGIFGFALMSSRTVLDAMNIALRFIDLSHTFSIPEVSVAGGQAVVEFDATRLPADLRRFLVERDLVATTQVLAELRPGGVPLDVGRARVPRTRGACALRSRAGCATQVRRHAQRLRVRRAAARRTPAAGQPSGDRHAAVDGERLSR